MRILFICTLLFVLAVQAFAQPTRDQSRTTKSSHLSRNFASVRQWQDQLMATDPKVRAVARTALVEGSPRSLPLLARLLNSRNEDLYDVTFEIIRRIGPPAIPLL